MLLIIVGAGATYDSDWRRPPGGLSPYQQEGIAWRPPLAKELFDEDRFGEYVARYPPRQGLMNQLRQAGEAVESELERIRDLSKDQEHLPHQLLAVRYYLRDLIEETVELWNKAKPDRMTNFTQFLTRLEPWRQQQSRRLGNQERVAIVTFNYDTLFDDALTNLLPRFHLRGIHDYTADPRYQLFKLHGSVNWWRDVRGAIIGNRAWTDDFGYTLPSLSWAPTMFDAPGPFHASGNFHVGAGTYPP